MKKPASALPAWQEGQWREFQQSLRAQRMPHALLLHGPAGLGKLSFAQRVAGALLCTHENGPARPCGECRGCNLAAAGNHPDFALVRPLEDKKAIGVDQIRELCDALSLKSYAGGHKVAIVCPAEAMTPNASNSLLKTLEEPGAGTVILLVSAQPSVMPPTIKSRCRQVRFHRPGADEALKWLGGVDDALDWEPLIRLAGGGPFGAWALAQDETLVRIRSLESDFAALLAGRADPIAVAGRWVKFELDFCLDWLSLEVMDLIRQKSGLPAQRAIANNDLQNTVKNINLHWLFRYLDRLCEARRLMRGSTNAQLMLESLLMPWAAGELDAVS